jgi:hypothetical protein
MNRETIINLVKDWRVALLLLLVVGSLIGISSSVSTSRAAPGCRWSSSP